MIRTIHGHHPDYLHVLIDIIATTVMAFLSGLLAGQERVPAMIVCSMITLLGVAVSWADLHRMTWDTTTDDGENPETHGHTVGIPKEGTGNH